jgi:hypothetical protein
VHLQLHRGFWCVVSYAVPLPVVPGCLVAFAVKAPVITLTSLPRFATFPIGSFAFSSLDAFAILASFASFAFVALTTALAAVTLP